MKFFIYILSVLSLSSCVPKKVVAEVQNRNIQLSKEVAELNNEVNQLESEIKELSSASSPLVGNNDEYKRFNYFYNLKPSAEIPIPDFFQNGSKFVEENKRLMQLLTKLGYDQNYYKYFGAPDGYGIVTFLDPINNDGASILSKRENPEISTCKWFDLFCSGVGYYRMYVFLVTKKLPPGNRKMSYSEINTYYESNIDFEYKWQNLPAVKNFINNNVSDDNYTLIVRIYDFKKEDFGGAEMLSSPVNSNCRQNVISKARF